LAIVWSEMIALVLTSNQPT